MLTWNTDIDVILTSVFQRHTKSRSLTLAASVVNRVPVQLSGKTQYKSIQIFLLNHRGLPKLNGGSFFVENQKLGSAC